MAAGLGYPLPYPDAAGPGYPFPQDRAGDIAATSSGGPQLGHMATLATDEPAPPIPGYGGDQQAAPVCGHCSEPIEGEESHLHGGAPNDTAVSPIVAAWRAASQRYTQRRSAAFATFRAGSDRAWQDYQRAVANAGAIYDRAVLEASRDYDRAVISWGEARDLPMLPTL